MVGFLIVATRRTFHIQREDCEKGWNVDYSGDFPANWDFKTVDNGFLKAGPEQKRQCNAICTVSFPLSVSLSQ